MIHLYWWLGIGVVTLVASFCELRLKKEPGSETLSEILKVSNPGRKNLSYDFLNNVAALVLVVILILIVWPAVIYLRVKEMFEKSNGVDAAKERAFAVGHTHFTERLSVEEIVQREIVFDPLGAVPALPFGHLHGAWKEFLTALPKESEIWSFSAEGKSISGRKVLRKGYVAVYCGVSGPYLMTVRREFTDDV